MNRRQFLKQCSTLTGTLVFSSCAGSLISKNKKTKFSSQNQPNIIVMLADDLGYSDLGCYNSEFIQTPNLDKLASEGTKFTSSYSAAPLCSPARAALLTGRVPARSAIYTFIPVETGHPIHLKTNEVTIASLLKNVGYETAHFGKWHLNSSMDPADNFPQPDNHGFDYSFGTCGAARDNTNKKSIHPNNFWRNRTAVGKLKGYPCEIVVNDAMDWLENKRNKNKPFFQYICFNEPHNPILEAAEMPPEIMKKYPPPIPEKDARYFATVSTLDWQIGRFLDKIKKLNLDENTFVVFASDNGPLHDFSQNPLRGYKSQCYEGGIRTPGIIRFPELTKPGTECDVPISFIDFAPTFCELSGAKIPTDRKIDGISILPIFKNKKLIRKTPLFCYFFRDFPQASLREGDWVMIAKLDSEIPKSEHRFHCSNMHFLKEKPLIDFELYNIKNDIGQQNNLATKEPKRFKAMKKKIIELHKEVIEEGYTWPDSDFEGTEWELKNN